MACLCIASSSSEKKTSFAEEIFQKKLIIDLTIIIY